MTTLPYQPRPAPPSSMVVTRIGGREYPMRSVSVCKTCQDPNRLHIENELIKGRSYKTIALSLTGLPQSHLGHPSPEGISEHVRQGHLPLGPASQRRLIERRATEIGRSIDDADDTLVDYVTVNQMIVSRGFERMQAGEIEPDLADVLQASRFLHGIEQDAGGEMDQQAFREILLAYMETVVLFIPPERHQEFAAAMQRHPVIMAAQRSLERQAIEGAEAV